MRKGAQFFFTIKSMKGFEFYFTNLHYSTVWRRVVASHEIDFTLRSKPTTNPKNQWIYIYVSISRRRLELHCGGQWFFFMIYYITLCSNIFKNVEHVLSATVQSFEKEFNFDHIFTNNAKKAIFQKIILFQMLVHIFGNFIENNWFITFWARIPANVWKITITMPY